MTVRPPTLRVVLADDEAFVDNFAGGGGASEGIVAAIGRDPDIAVNHDREALAMHAANHPNTRHLCEDVYDVDPREVCRGKRVRGAWFSPDCTYHSKARGAAPFRDPRKAKRRRGLAWVITRWAHDVHPDVIFMENVEEFEEWGPLLNDGRPDPDRAGFTFRRWVKRLQNLGYVVEWRQLRACDYGAPTSRKRLFVVARCDGAPIVWPQQTHGPAEARDSLFVLPTYRPAADAIDWSIPCRSIFGRKRPLADNTLRRIARGIIRFVVNDPDPFIVPLRGTHGHSSVHSVDDPLSSVSAQGTHHALVDSLLAPVLTEHANASNPRSWRADEPLRTICANVKGGHFATVVPYLIETGNGEREGQAPRVMDIEKPFGTVTSTGSQGALALAFLASHYGRGENDGSDFRASFPTITAKDHHMVTAAELRQVTGYLDRSDEVYALLVKFYGNEKGGESLREPLDTITTKDRFGLVTVQGREYQIVDIGMRMLTPRELYNAQGFRRNYVIDPLVEKVKKVRGREVMRMQHLTKTAQIRMVGNSVVPQLAEALVRANLRVRERAERHTAADPA